MTAPPVSSLSPPVEVRPPDLTPYRYGLLSAAQRIEEGGRWELGGVAYTTDDCPNKTAEWVTTCPIIPPPEPLPEKSISIGLDEVVGKPFMLYDAIACVPQSGRTEEELRDMAAQSLIAGEQNKLEEKFFEQMRADSVVVDAPTPPGYYSFVTGLGVLEHRLAQISGGVGVIHAPRFLLPVAAFLKLTRHVGDQVLDPADNPWAFGAGYTTKGPPLPGNPDNPAPPGQAWIYATGPVVLRRAPITTHTVFDHHRNERQALAERSYVLTVECPAIAVLVQVPEL